MNVTLISSTCFIVQSHTRKTFHHESLNIESIPFQSLFVRIFLFCNTWMSLPSANLRKKTTFQKRRKSTQPHLKCLRVLRWLMLSNWLAAFLIGDQLNCYLPLKCYLLSKCLLIICCCRLHSNLSLVSRKCDLWHIFVRGHQFVWWIKMVNAV